MADSHLFHHNMLSYRALPVRTFSYRVSGDRLGLSRETLERILEWAVLVEDEFPIIAPRDINSPIIVLDDDYYTSRAAMIQTRQSIGLVCRLWREIIQQGLWKSFTIGCKAELVNFGNLIPPNSYIRTKILRLDCFMQQRSPLKCITDDIITADVNTTFEIWRSIERERAWHDYLYHQIFSTCSQIITFHHICGNLWPFPRFISRNLVRFCVSVQDIPWRDIFRTLYSMKKLEILGLYNAPHWVNKDFKPANEVKLVLAKLHTLEVSFSCEGNLDDETSENFNVAFEEWISCPKLDAVKVKYWDRDSVDDMRHRLGINPYISREQRRRMIGIGHGIFSLGISALDVDFPIQKEDYNESYTTHRTPWLRHLEFSFGGFHMLQRMENFVSTEWVQFIAINDLGRLSEEWIDRNGYRVGVTHSIEILKEILEPLHDMDKFPSLQTVVLSGLPLRAGFLDRKSVV